MIEPCLTPASELLPTPPEVACTLGTVDVEIWTAMLDTQPGVTMQHLRSVLSDDERARADRFHFERDRRRFEIARGILRMLLGRHVGRPAREIEFEYGPNGKPALSSRSGKPHVHFNLAHAEGMAVYAFTRVGEVGVDLERIRPIPEWEQIAKAQFSAEAGRRIRAATEADRPLEFLKAWTREEALLKASGEGLGAASSHAARNSAREQYAVRELPIAQDYVAAFAISPAARWLTQREWPPAEDFDHPHTRPRARRIQLSTFTDHRT